MGTTSYLLHPVVYAALCSPSRCQSLRLIQQCFLFPVSSSVSPGELTEHSGGGGEGRGRERDGGGRGRKEEGLGVGGEREGEGGGGGEREGEGGGGGGEEGGVVGGGEEEGVVEGGRVGGPQDTDSQCTPGGVFAGVGEFPPTLKEGTSSQQQLPELKYRAEAALR